MGRALKRVPLDFEWPLEKTWKGYINTLARAAKECPQCAGSTYSPEAKRLTDVWYGNEPFRPEDRGSTPFKPTDAVLRALAQRNVESSPGHHGVGEAAIEREARRLCAFWNQSWSHHLNADDVAALIAADRLWDITHTWTPEQKWQPKVPAYVPTPEEVNIWSISGMGHDCCNAMVCVEAECKRLGVPYVCVHCHGEGVVWATPEAKSAAEAWTRTEPPAGPGYQMWETVTEGAPISPVFTSPEQLAQWLTDNRQGTVDEGTSMEQWMEFIVGPGWAPSFVMTPKGLLDGVKAAAEN